MNKHNIRQFLIWFRNGVAFCTTWLLILLLLRNQLLGIENVQTAVLCKLIFSIAGGVFWFCLAFLPSMLKKWSFTRRLTVFMLVFSVYECACFYWMGIFQRTGSLLQYGVFVGIVLLCYLICLGINEIYGRKRAGVYNDALRKYLKDTSPNIINEK